MRLDFQSKLHDIVLLGLEVVVFMQIGQFEVIGEFGEVVRLLEVVVVAIEVWEGRGFGDIRPRKWMFDDHFVGVFGDFLVLDFGLPQFCCSDVLFRFFVELGIQLRSVLLNYVLYFFQFTFGSRFLSDKFLFLI